MAVNYLDDDDKNVILDRRIQRVLSNKYDIHFMKASYITHEDDSKCYSMIKDVNYCKREN